jgi:hypothetical protein
MSEEPKDHDDQGRNFEENRIQPESPTGFNMMDDHKNSNKFATPMQ